MNRNTVLGLLLIGVILFGFSWYNTRQYTKQMDADLAAQREQSIKDSIIFANTPRPDSLKTNIAPDTATIVGAANQIAVTDTTQNQPAVETDGLVLSLKGEEEFLLLENELFKIKFSNKGGRVASVELKEYLQYGGAPLTLFSPESSNFGISFYCPELINSAEMYMEPRDITQSSITYRLSADSENYMEFHYKLRPGEYMMDMSVDLTHFKNRLALNQPDLILDWKMVAPQQEKGFKNENTHTTIAYKFTGESSTDDIGSSDGDKSQDITTNVEWIGFKQQFFSSIIINQEHFSRSNIGYTTFGEGSGNIKDFKASLTLPYLPTTDGYNFKFYFGPNKYTTLRDYKELSLHRLVPLGWGIFGWVNRFFVIPIVEFLSGFIGNFGIVILILTIIVKIVIMPMTYKSYLSTAKMRLLKPDIDKISEKFPKKEDAMKKQQATMALYKQAGVSPMGGCIPMLIQMPVLIALFRFFPSAIELRQKSFLWAEDLSSYDSIFDFPEGFSIPFYGDHISLFTLLMAVTLFINAKISADQQPSTNQMPGMKFMMLYLMPIMLLMVFNNYSSGLSWYFFLSTLMTVGITYLFRYVVVDDSKLHTQMKKNAKKPVKKSKWSERMEQIQKQADAQKRANKK